MKLGTIIHDGAVTTIARLEDATAVAVDVASMEDLIIAGDAGLAAADQALADASAGKRDVIDVSDADWMAPNPKASKIIGCAVNNNTLNEVAYRPMTSPMFFTKGRSALTGHNKPIVLLERHGRAIPEPEPVAVFGRLAKDIGDDDILDHVFGYTLTNDVTASGIKFGEDSIALDQKPDLIFPHHMAWRKRFEDDNFVYFIYHSRSKASDTFAAMGPWLTTKDEVPDPNKLTVRGLIDDEVFTEDSTSNYYFPVERVLSEASTWFTMEPGDCIHTGTAAKGNDAHPRGNLGVDLREYARCDVEIEGLGRLSNPLQSN